jgi:hypothetical protein
MSESGTELLSFRTERSEIEQRAKAFARTLEAEGIDKGTVIHAVQQTLLDLCLEEDHLRAGEKIEIMRHCGRTFLAIVGEVEDRISAIDRNRAVGLADSATN